LNGARTIQIRLNEQPCAVASGVTLRELAASRKPGADVVILNGFPSPIDAPLQDGDRVVLIRRGEIPREEELECLLVARHGPGVHEKIRGARVGVAGCGGLGSTVAVALARTGVGALVLADFDVVEPSNLNRQQYFVDQIGDYKVDALAANLARINPYVRVERHRRRVCAELVPELFGACDVVAECFDDPSAKAELATAMCSRLPGKPFVAVSGIAGHGPAERIRSRRIFGGSFLVGDGESAARPGLGLLAPRVTVAAGHQANVVLRLLLGDIAPHEGG
jgi:sulfur carrier protein ThiS adenylyltransferase